jgi:glycosyltransferase involved in cell wall biosynthesis
MHHRQVGYDVVHIVHGTYPEDPRVRREANVAAEVAKRVVVIALHQPNRPRAGHHDAVRVVRLPGVKRRGSALDYVREYVTFTARVFALFARDTRFRRARVVHVHTLPDFLIFATLPALRAGGRAILDLHEIFPEFVESKFAGIGGAIASRVARRLERASRALAAVTITVNEPIRSLLASRSARRDERIEIVHNVADPRDMGAPAPRSYAVGIPARLVYHGTLTPLYGLDVAIEAIARLRGSGKDVTLDIFGDGPARIELESLARRLGVSEAVTFHGSVTPGHLRRALPSFDAGLVPTRLDRMTHYSLSTKLLELFHLGIPVVASRIPTYVTYFTDDCAWYFAPDDPRSAALVIGDFVDASVEQRSARARAGQVAASGIGWAGESARLASLYRELLEPRPEPSVKPVR